MTHIPKPSGNPTDSTFKIFHCSPPPLPNDQNLGPRHHHLTLLNSVPSIIVYIQQNSEKDLLKPKYAVSPMFKTLPTHWFPITLGAKTQFSSALQSYQIYLAHLFSPPHLHLLLPLESCRALGSSEFLCVAAGLTPGLWLLHSLPLSALGALSLTLIPIYFYKAHQVFIFHSRPHLPHAGICLHCSPSS